MLASQQKVFDPNYVKIMKLYQQPHDIIFETVYVIFPSQIIFIDLKFDFSLRLHYWTTLINQFSYYYKNKLIQETIGVFLQVCVKFFFWRQS